MQTGHETTREIEMTVTTKEKKMVRVTFPIYSEHAMDDCTIYRRVDANLVEYAIWVWDRQGIKIEMEIDSVVLNGADDYMLGRGEYASTEADFEKARKKFLDVAEAALK